MKEDTISLVQTSWKQVVPIADTAADLFYSRLFELDSTLKLLFPAELKEQKIKLIRMLGVAVGSLGNADKLVPVLEDLGRRHSGYGVMEKHYETVGESLLWTLEKGLGDAFTLEVKTAWVEVYSVVADTMKAAAAAVPEAAVSPFSIALVQGTWAMVKPIREEAAELFYGRLFELDPSLRPMFKSDIKSQGRKLMQALSVAVNGLKDLERLVPVLENLGRGHQDYGVTERHYETVGESLLWTLEKGLQEAFTPDVKVAWTEVYGVVAGTMKKAAAAVAAE